MTYNKRCRVCGAGFETTVHNRELCSEECQLANKQEKRRLNDSQNRDAVNARQREWRKANYDPVKQRVRYEKNRVYRANADMVRKYGITLEDYNRMLEAQGGHCAICPRVPGTKRLPVDHNHDTGAVRGILCDRCNRAIGLLGDSTDLLESALNYLRNSDEQPPA